MTEMQMRAVEDSARAPVAVDASRGGDIGTRTAVQLSEVVDRAHLPALDGLRAVAVGLVILGHTNYPVRGVPGDLGVSLFFVLSGFLITRLLLREWDRAGAISLRGFYVRRTLRIFPAYYAFLCLSFVVDRYQGQSWSPALVGSAATYTMNYFNALHGHPTTSVAHAWSLAVEEQFYLLWPVVFVLSARFGKRAQVMALVMLAMTAMGWRSWLAVTGRLDTAYLYKAFDTRFDNLAIGCLLAFLLQSPRLLSMVDRLSQRTWSPLVTIGLLLTSRLATTETYHYAIGFTVDAVLAAILLSQLLVLHTRAPWRWLDQRVVRFLGTISYPLYLYHLWGASVGRHLPLTTEGGRFLGSLLATILLASVSYFVIERPFLRLKRHLPVSTPRGLPVAVRAVP